MRVQKGRGSMVKGHIHSLETFGTVDGPGIRFVLLCKDACSNANIVIILTHGHWMAGKR